MSTELFNQPVKTFLKKLPVAAVYLFGSQTSDYVNRESDYDIAIFVEDKTKVDSHLIYRTIIDNCVAPEKVHLTLVDCYNSSPLLLYEIIKTGILLYEVGANEAVVLSTRAMTLYFDDQYRRDIFYYYLKQRYYA